MAPINISKNVVLSKVFGLLESLLSYLVNLLLQIISSSGYLGVMFLMTLESAVIPVPSEVVMPFAGYLVSQGKLDFWLVILASTVGNLIGSMATYSVGMYMGRGAIIKYGKYILLREHHLMLAENWFRRYGQGAVFLGRMLPVVRTVIALPAGIARMNFPKFAAYTFIGSIPWNVALVYAGVWLGSNWVSIEGYTRWLYIPIVIGALVAISWFVLRRRKK